jgi:capsid protein
MSFGSAEAVREQLLGVIKHRMEHPVQPMMGYDAISDQHRRAAPRPLRYSEDDHLLPMARRRAISTITDQLRNIVLLAWMVRQHLANVCRHNFHAATGDEDLDRMLEKFISEQSAARNFDLRQKFNRQKTIELLEGRAVADGDSFLLKVQPHFVQGLEGDRIGPPLDMPADHIQEGRRWIHGIEVDMDKGGRALRYTLLKRNWSLLYFDRYVPASSVIMHGYFNRWDQIRGVSPLLAVCNQAEDLYETIEFSYLKAKFHAMVAFAVEKIHAEGAGGMPIVSRQPNSTNGLSQTVDNSGNMNAPVTTAETIKSEVRPGAAGILDLYKGEKVDVVESKSPSIELQSFTELEIKLILLALDIPYIFYDALKGSYSVHRSIVQQYEQSCAPKREAIQEVLDAWTAWRLMLAFEDGECPPPSAKVLRAGKFWKWEPAARPWIDPLDMRRAQLFGVAGGIESLEDIAHERGKTAFQIIDENAAVIAYAKKKGMVLDFSGGKGASEAADNPAEVAEEKGGKGNGA